MTDGQMAVQGPSETLNPLHSRQKQEKKMSTLGDELPKEMARIRDVVMPVYREIGPAGGFALAFMKRDLTLPRRQWPKATSQG
jgi:hypothetical protein